MNWPQHRGTATAFPLSAFGLSAFFFSAVSHLALPGDTAGFLLFLSFGTFIMIAGSTVFIRILPQNSPTYAAVPTDESKMWTTQPGSGVERGTPEPVSDVSEKGLASEEDEELTKWQLEDPTAFELDDMDPLGKTAASTSAQVDVKGWALLKHMEFYQQFLLLGSVTGIGLMTIK